MKISNKRREEIAIEFVKTVDPRWDLRQICDYWLNILDQELSNHTQRVREEIEFLIQGIEIKGRGDKFYALGASVLKDVLTIPSLQTNPTKDNEEITYTEGLAKTISSNADNLTAYGFNETTDSWKELKARQQNNDTTQ